MSVVDAIRRTHPNAWGWFKLMDQSGGIIATSLQTRPRDLFPGVAMQNIAMFDHVQRQAQPIIRSFEPQFKKFERAALMNMISAGVFSAFLIIVIGVAIGVGAPGMFDGCKGDGQGAHLRALRSSRSNNNNNEREEEACREAGGEPVFAAGGLIIWVCIMIFGGLSSLYVLYSAKRQRKELQPLMVQIAAALQADPKLQGLQFPVGEANVTAKFMKMDEPYICISGATLEPPVGNDGNVGSSTVNQQVAPLGAGPGPGGLPPPLQQGPDGKPLQQQAGGIVTGQPVAAGQVVAAPSAYPQVAAPAVVMQPVAQPAVIVQQPPVMQVAAPMTVVQQPVVMQQAAVDEYGKPVQTGVVATK